MPAAPLPAHLRPSCRVLLIEDDAALRAALTFSLEMEGYKVDAHDSGESLFRQPIPARFCCMVLDQRLPGVDGLAVLEQLRRSGERAPALLITTNPTAKLRGQAHEVGLEIVEKPLMGDSLLRAVNRVSRQSCDGACMHRDVSPSG